ncbi:MaoC family dehydratase N-terminal domain-containing protein [Desulfallas sp. Bu1-1]|uniref:MaoC/PaaZ C-terminal domain-containing protein n=1 Tax=Desulfallas sp. Bu1-1 TaxID=2787620 RepID=UPI00189F6A58|nr:MaoC/PaaZ C-terminal domain-containing protein [Desulfallas sp. Bu1-1]MBF7082999.1 MaoC family dehydratase N-terminal domain-containing protein [Desulfallas sp. Bu1-1]
MGLYFEDFKVGQKFTSPGRTITESDVMQFAGLSMDFNPLHTDYEFAKGTIFGRPIAHGLLGLCIASGLTYRMGIFNESAIANLGIKEWNMKAPIFFGDTVHVEVTIKEKRKTSNPSRGILVRETKLIKQDGTVVQEGLIILMVKCRE